LNSGRALASMSANTSVHLQLRCDLAVSPHWGFTFGRGWARVRLALPPPCDWAATLPPFFMAAKAVFDLMHMAVEPVPTQLSIGGPDVPLDIERLRGIMQRAWAAAVRGVPAREKGEPLGPTDPKTSAPHGAPPEPSAASPEAHPRSAPAVSERDWPRDWPPAQASAGAQPCDAGLVLPQPPGAVPAAPPAKPAALRRADANEALALQAAEARAQAGACGVSELLVSQMTDTVRAYISRYGSAPNFRDPCAQKKAFNYIRSTCASPNAVDSLVEAVRRRLAEQ
jgi:hypothetical protein